MPDDDVLPEKDLFEKAAAVKRSEYLPLSSELKKQTDITQKQNQGLDKIDEFGKKKKDDDDKHKKVDDKTMKRKWMILQHSQKIIKTKIPQ